MRTGIPVLLVAALAVASCKNARPTEESRPKPTQPIVVLATNLPPSMSKQEAEGLLTLFHVGMTVGDVRRLFPNVSVEEQPVWERGGAWFILPVGQDYSIQFRAAHPKPGDIIEHSRINYSPRLRDRKTQKFISGEERTW